MKKGRTEERRRKESGSLLVWVLRTGRSSMVEPARAYNYPATIAQSFFAPHKPHHHNKVASRRWGTMVQHSNWHVGVPPSHGTTFDLVIRCTTQPWYNIQTGTSVYHPAMVQHSNWYVGVPPSHGTTFKLVRRCTTQPSYNIQTGTSVYHPAMVQHLNWYIGVPHGQGTSFKLVRRCTTRPWYNIQTGTSVYHPAMLQHLTWYVGVPPAMVQHSNW